MSTWTGLFIVEHIGADGNLIIGPHNPDVIHNNLADEGENNLLDSYLRNQNHPSSFYIRLFNDTPGDTDSLSSLTGEPGFPNGYAPQNVLRSGNALGWSLGWAGGNAQASSVQSIFNCWATFTVTYAVLATTSDNSGRHVSYAALSSTKTLSSGEQLRVTYKPSLS